MTTFLPAEAEALDGRMPQGVQPMLTRKSRPGVMLFQLRGPLLSYATFTNGLNQSCSGTFLPRGGACPASVTCNGAVTVRLPHHGQKACYPCGRYVRLRACYRPRGPRAAPHEDEGLLRLF